MEERRLPRILIVTAGYGEGHNSAARGVQAALEGRAETRLADLCAEAMPATFKLTRAGYLWVISSMPGLWKLMYDATDRRNMAEKPIKGLGPVKQMLEQVVNEWRPDAVVCTYMVYPYMLDAIELRTGRHIPYMTVVTDSIVINKSWLCSRSPLWAVTDPWTKEVMAGKGIDAEKISVTGFPVNPALCRLAKENPIEWAPGEPFRVLYFAQRSATHARAELNAILEAAPEVCVTCILGRKFRKIYPHIADLRSKYGSRLTVRGWTQQVPAYLAKHHVVVSKAGGATVHETLAAARPMLVNFLLPGQEEGNTRLLEYLGGGRCALTPDELRDALKAMMAEGGAAWRSMHECLLRADMTGGGGKIADLVLNMAVERTN